MAKRQTRYVVLEALRQQGGEFLSSTALTEKLGVTRAAIWKAVVALKEEGYPIRSVTGEGYALEGEPDVLSEREIARRLATHWLGRALCCQPQMESTSAHLKALAAGGELRHGLVAVAGEQTGGRGRGGRSFYSPPGGLYFSAALQQPLPLSALRLLTLASAVAICEGIADCCGLQVDIKWPNDLYWRGRKLGGILTECSLVGESGELEYAVCGAGLNCAATPCPPELRGEIVSLEEALGGPPPARAALLAALLQRLEGAFDRLLQGEGGRSLLEGYRARLLWVGETVEVSRGSERYRAVFEGVDGEGRALLQTVGEVQALSSGEIRLKKR